MRCPDDDDVARDHGRGVETDLPRDEIDRLVELCFQIDNAVVAEPADAVARLGVERNELITRRHVEDAFGLAVSPVLTSHGRTAGAAPRRHARLR